MKRSHAVLLTVTAGVGLLLVLLSMTVGRSAPTLAAPQVVSALVGLPGEGLAPSHQGVITCTLASTTTDSLAYAYNYTYTNAVPLSNYSGLALAVGDKGQNAPAEDDWFRLDNANPGSTYVVEAVPDKTTNYNLGIVVYDASLVEIDRDADAVNFSAKVELEATGHGPYFFRVYQITAGCSGGTYHLDTSIPSTDSYEPNDSMAAAYTLPVGSSASVVDANFVPSSGGPTPDVDWYAFYVKSERRYRASTSNLDDVDTYVEVYTRDCNKIAQDDDSGGGYASKVEWQSAYDGYYYVRVINLVATTGSYDLTIEVLSPTNTPIMLFLPIVSTIIGCTHTLSSDLLWLCR